MILIDKLCYTSKLRYVNPGVKSAFAFITLFICVSDRSILLSALILFSMSLISIWKGGISFRYYRKLLGLPLVFLFLSVIAIIINISKVPLSAFAIPIGNWYVTCSYSSLLFATQLVLTSLASVSCLYFLSLSTSITDILSVLRRIHCPKVFIELMLLIYRFIFVFMDMADSLRTAQQSRLGNVDFRTSLRTSGALISALFIRVFKKSSALYNAMESRCYNGEILVLEEHYPALKMHIGLIVLFDGALILISLILRTIGLHL